VADIRSSIVEQRASLERLLAEPVLAMTAEAIPEWGRQNVIEKILGRSLGSLPYCRALYAMDQAGTQFGGTMMREGLDLSHHGRDRSQRPYMSEAFRGADFALSDAYISQNARRPSITAVFAVRQKGSLLGYIGADFDLRELPLTGKLYEEPGQWRQIKGDPAIRGQLFYQVRSDSLLDLHIDDILAVVDELMAERGVFHGKIHFSSSRATVWVREDPYRYRILGFEDLVNADICLAYPMTAYAQDAVVPKAEIKRVLDAFRKLRFADETIYLRSGSLNIFNGMVGLNFSCDGSHYMSFREFLDKDYEFWVGDTGNPCAIESVV
jgi:hypothetical protein